MGLIFQKKNYEKKQIKSDVITLTYVGRLIREKGVHILIEALAHVKNLECFQLVIVGDGPCRRELETLSEKYGISDKVNFVGFQKNVSDYLKKSDIFVHPAIWEEGFGIAIVEAMREGLVCVAFRKGAIPEIITDEVNGYIVNECSTEALAKKLDEIQEKYQSEEMRMLENEEMKRARFFSIDKVVKQLDDLYVCLQK